MTEAEAMFTEGFAELERVFRPTSGAVTITTGTGESAVTKSCVFSNVDAQRVLKETGFTPMYQAIAELTRADAATLGLYPMETSGKRPECVTGGRTYKRVNLEDDPHDLCVRLHLQNLT